MLECLRNGQRVNEEEKDKQTSILDDTWESNKDARTYDEVEETYF